MKKIVLGMIVIGFGALSQPNRPDNSSHPACQTPNPPWWCDNNPDNPAPLDDYLPILFIGGAVIGGYFYYKKQLKTSKL